MVVEHAFGRPGSGGVYRALELVVGTSLSTQFTLVPMVQSSAARGLNVRLVVDFIRLIRRSRAQLVHVRGLGNEGFHAALAARLAGCRRVLVSVHGTQRDLRGRPTLRRRIVVRILEPATILMASHVATVCEYAGTRPFVLRAPAEYLGAIPNGVPQRSPDAEGRARIRKELGIDERSVVVVFVGRVTSDKGVDQIHMAAGQLASDPSAPPIHFLVVGDGPLRVALERDASDRSLPLVFAGAQQSIWPYLDAADIFLLPSWHENLSFALLEAMSSGLPCVASDVGGNTEVLSRGGGVLFPAGDIGAMISGLTHLARNDGLRAEMGNEAKRVAADCYSVDRMAAGWARAYAKALGEKPSGNSAGVAIRQSVFAVLGRAFD